MLIFLIARLSSSVRTGTQFGFLHHYASRTSYSFSSISNSSQSNRPQKTRDENHSFTISCLMNSCGLSAEVAGEISKKIELKDSDKLNSILGLLRSFGFSDPHISKLAACYPRLLLSDPENNLLPKLKFIQSLGFSASEISELLSFNPKLLMLNLEKRIIPHYEALKSVLHDDWKVRKCLKCSTWSVGSYDVKNMVPNIKVLRDEGVPESLIFSLLSKRANVAFMNQSKFDEYVKFVKEIGTNPFQDVFVEALIIITQMNKSTWELKLDTFEKFGWSREVTLSAFSRAPKIMAMSENNITDTMKFFIEKMGLRLEEITGSPCILRYSLKNRIAPRWSVLNILKKKGLINKDISLISIIVMSETKFLKDFVIKFQENVPRLLKLYRGELGPLPKFRPKQFPGDNGL